MKKGIVKITGAGIGPSDLLTIRAKEALESADVIVYDRLLNEDIISQFFGKKEMYFAGKKAGNHYLSQDETNELIAKKALEGKNVVRLKGGDPYIFGRGGEEAEYLVERGVDFEVIPGITSGVLSLMYAGIPATHRDAATSVSFITGHRMEGVESGFSQYGKLDGTLVFYMGLNNIERLIEDLIKGGIPKERPAGVIMHGGYPDQKVLISTVENICKDIEGKDFGSPSLIVIGEVLNFRDKLNFYENLPLFGKKIVVTRAQSQASNLVKKLKDLGAIVIEAPCIDIREVINEDFIETIKNFKDGEFTHLVFHSVNAAEIFFKNFLIYNDIRDLYGIKICSIGKKTSQVIRGFGLKPDLELEEFIGEYLVEEISQDKIEDKKILLGHSNLTGEDLLDKYREIGKLINFVIYENKIPTEKVEIPEEVEYVLFTSSSTVENFKQLYGLEILEEAKVISIGKVTSETIEKNNIKLYGESKVATIDSMIDFIQEDVKNENEKN